MRTRIFKNGNSQVVRIPASMRFECDEVEIERDPKTGVITLRPSVAPFIERWQTFMDRVQADPSSREISDELARVSQEVQDEDQMPEDGDLL